MLLVKALKVSADMVLFDDNQNPNKSKELTKMVRRIVEAEVEKVLHQTKQHMRDEIDLFLASKKIPEEDKTAIFRQIRNLMRIYEQKEGGGE